MPVLALLVPGLVIMNRRLSHKESERTQPESFSDDDEVSSLPDEPIVYTDEELDAMRQVRAKLTEEHGVEPSRVGSAFLAVATVNCKLRVDETTTKIKKLLEIMEKLGCPDGIDDELWKPKAAHELKPYAPTGKDRSGCRITWIRGGDGVSREEERNHCHACLMQYLATHADSRTLRNGVSFIIDVSGRDDMAKRKAVPMRPQIIMIAGASLLLRTFVNASIRLASIFIKQKMLQRIHFVTVEYAKGTVPTKSAPVYTGGEGGGIESYEGWVKDRLETLPVPNL